MSPKRGNVTFASGFNLSNNTGRNCKYQPAVRESVFDSEKTRPNARCKANKQSWTVPIEVTIQVVVYSHWRRRGAAEAPWLPGIPSNEADVPARADSTSSDQTDSEQFVGAFIQYEERYHRAQRQITVKASQESN